VSVAVAARSLLSLRQVGVEDQAVVLHLLAKRRQDLVADVCGLEQRIASALADSILSRCCA
jgi:hypothetical protein